MSEVQKYELPNGMVIAHLNQNETKFMYHEVFEEKTYIKNGISVDGQSIVFDIGANIGMFSLFIKRLACDAVIYAFEPAPVLFRILQHNLSTFGPSVIPFQLGVSDCPKESIFTYYPQYSILSGFHADASVDEQILLSCVSSRWDHLSVDQQNRLKKQSDPFIKQKLSKKEEFKCRFTTVSEVIKNQNISRIDLLKIDAEKSESSIIKGIQDPDWPKIKQIVMEVHDEVSGGKQAEDMSNFLKVKGYNIILEEEKELKGSGVVNLYALRNYT